MAFVAVEAVAGLKTGSLTLVADAGHNLSDVASLLLAWGAMRLAGRSASPRRTYGFRMGTVLASLASAVLLRLALGATGMLWIDPVLSLIIVAVVLVSTWSLLRESTHLVVDGVPEDIDAAAVRAWLENCPDVAAVHHIHIWAPSTTEVALTAHLVTPASYPGVGALEEISDGLRRRFSIDHATLQVEVVDPRHDCPLTDHDATETRSMER